MLRDAPDVAGIVGRHLGFAGAVAGDPRLQARRVLIVKHRVHARRVRAAAGRDGVVDRAFPRFLAGFAGLVTLAADGLALAALAADSRSPPSAWPDHADGSQAALGLGADRIGALLHRDARSDPPLDARGPVRQPRRGRGGAHVQGRSSTCRPGRAHLPRHDRERGAGRAVLSRRLSHAGAWRRRRPTRSPNALSASPTTWPPTCSPRPANAACR